MAVKPRLQSAAPTGPVLYGDTPARGTVGSDGWAGHNGIETWSDGGSSERVVDHATGEFFAGLDQLLATMKTGLADGMQATVADQVKDAVGEYMANLMFSIGVSDGELIVAASAVNDRARVTSYVPLLALLAEARTKAMADPAYFGALQKFAQMVVAGMAKPAAAQAGAPVRPPSGVRRPNNAAPMAQPQHHVANPDGAFADFGAAPLTRKG